jgi:hypothetical protein
VPTRTVISPGSVGWRYLHHADTEMAAERLAELRMTK